MMIRISIAVISMAAAAWSQTPEVKLAEQAYTNIVELKGVAADQVLPAMQFMSTSLGVDCNFCHVQGDNASDDNPKKLVARKMIEMVNDINAKFPDGKVHVSCYTCHRGKTTPDMVPPPAAPPGQ